MILFKAIYWLAIKAYGFILYVASFFNKKAKLFVSGRKGLIETIVRQLGNEQRPRIWMHCASLGEFEQGRPVLERLRKDYPLYAIVLTFFSPSGYEARKNYTGADHIFYLPLDGPDNARQFLAAVRPELCLFVKYEFWYFYLSAINKQGINSVLISGIFRKSQPFFKWYGMLHRTMLHCFTHIFLQNETSAILLRGIGIDAVTVNGDTRFDRVVEAAQQKEKLYIANAFCQGYKIIVAGSTWKEDELLLKKAIDLMPLHWKLILVPHEVDEQHIEAIENIFEGKALRWTRWNDQLDRRVLIVDQVGLLIQLYRFATIAWIGGGFGSAGVHNVLEAAVYGIPCAFGPVYHQFNEAVELIESGGGFSITHPSVFADNLLQGEKNNAAYQKAGLNAQNYVFAHIGASDAVMGYVAAKNLLMI